MNTIINELTKIVKKAFVECGYSESAGEVIRSNRPDLAQFQANGAFLTAKKYKIPPITIANNVVEFLSSMEIFSNVSVANPGFINISLTDDYIINWVNRMVDDKYLGIPQISDEQTIIIDYGGPNIAKPLHVGHLRSAIIGESIKRIASIIGYNAIGDIHLGDWGMPIGLIIAELEERSSLECDSVDLSLTSNIKKLTIDDLNEIYPFASKKSKENNNFKLKAKKITCELQQGNKEYLYIWNKIVQISIADLKQNYSRLNVNFDLWKGESDSEQYIPELIDILTSKKLLKRSLGALIVDVSKPDDNLCIPPIIIKKSDNSNLYSTTDLATIIQRQKELSPKKYWYVADNRQSLHFEQVFRCAQIAGLVHENVELEFLGFGTMNGKDQKPYKTREGGVMKLSELLEMAESKAMERIQNSKHLEASEEEKKEIARKVSIAAIKFGDLSNNRTKDYVFDLDKFLAKEGKTGAYILYTISRINSIVKRAKKVKYNCKLEKLYSDEERQILLNVMATGDVFLHSLKEKAPHYICESVYQIATSFSKFYSNTNIIFETDESKRSTWISLIKIVKIFIMKHLDALGIESVEQM